MIKTKIKYRKIRLDEIPILIDYRIKFLIELQGLQSSEKEKELRKELNDYFRIAFRDNTFSAWIAEFDSLVVGFGAIVIQRIPGNFDLINGFEGYVLNMYTVPEYRNNGICSALLDKLINEGKELGLNKIYLHASADGIELYRKKGFKEPDFPELELMLK